MSDTRHTLTAVLFGALLGAGAFWLFELSNDFDAYQTGAQSVLERRVTVGGDPVSPCAIEIPLHVLVDMVNSGVMLWHEHCKETPHD